VRAGIPVLLISVASMFNRFFCAEPKTKEKEEDTDNL